VSAAVGFVVGGIGLVALKAATSSAAAGTRAGGIVSAAGKVISYVVDPTVPAIPQRGAPKVTGSSAMPALAIVPPIWDSAPGSLGKSPATTDRSPGTEGVGKGG
jgi:hypothetical protein